MPVSNGPRRSFQPELLAQLRLHANITSSLIGSVARGSLTMPYWQARLWQANQALSLVVLCNNNAVTKDGYLLTGVVSFLTFGTTPDSRPLTKSGSRPKARSF